MGSESRSSIARDLSQMREIQKEKENIERLIRGYQRRNEELREKELELIKKIDDTKPDVIDLRKVIENSQRPEGYMLSNSMYGFGIGPQETKKQKIDKLREEVLQKQFQNMKLEKELENRKEEHRRFHEMLGKRAEAMGPCFDSNCSDFIPYESMESFLNDENTHEVNRIWDRTSEDEMSWEE